MQVVGVRACFHRVHWVQVCQAFGASGPAEGWLWSFRGVFPAFCPLFCFMLVALLANMPLFAILKGFLARFIGFVWVCIGCVLCVACVAFVRVNS